jgi:DmsE family decaheme c-type cytochrome
MNTFHHHRFFALLGTSALAWSMAVILVGAQAPTPDPPRLLRTAVAAPAQAQRAGAPSDYLGNDVCLGCHVEKEESYRTSAHGRSANPRSPAANLGCESCHGPGAAHVENPSANTALRKFRRMAPREVSDACVSCHSRGTQALWAGSAHDARNLSCASCHSMHAPTTDTPLLKAAIETDLCATCHRVQAMKFRRASHMPVNEGGMRCSTCHNPHGSTNVRQLRVGGWINESCLSCHTEKRGPFLFEHAAGRESCVTCHDPHGSSNDRLLVAKLPMLCQRCHIGTRHPSTIYDSAAVRSRSSRIIGRSCVNCHSQVHGSNHPSGQALIR